MTAMKKRDSAAPSPAAVRRTILRWYASHRRDLPWRRTRDPWKILMSEVMLQQTQVDRVVPKYEAFVRAWPTPAAMAAAPLAEVLRAWSGLGYNRRAAHLKAAADAVTAGGGRMPDDVEGLEALPGVGRYTARAVAAFAHNRDVVLWDTNVRRIALRVAHGGEFAPDPGVEVLESVLAKMLPVGRSRDWHNALMDFGSAICLGRAPRCGSCPLRRTCLAAPKFLAGATPPRGLVRPQAKFDGSRRQARGMVLRLLTGAGRDGLPTAEVRASLGRPDAADVLRALADEGLVTIRRGRVALP